MILGLLIQEEKLQKESRILLKKINNLSSKYKQMASNLKKTLNRIIVFILSLPFAIPLLSPIILLYFIYLSTSPQGRVKLKRYYALFLHLSKLIIGCFSRNNPTKRAQSRSALWQECKNYWNGVD